MKLSKDKTMLTIELLCTPPYTTPPISVPKKNIVSIWHDGQNIPEQKINCYVIIKANVKSDQTVAYKISANEFDALYKHNNNWAKWASAPSSLGVPDYKVKSVNCLPPKVKKVTCDAIMQLEI